MLSFTPTKSGGGGAGKVLAMLKKGAQQVLGYSPVDIWYDLKQIATEYFFTGMHSGEVSLKHTKNPLRHLWGKQGKSAIKVTFSH